MCAGHVFESVDVLPICHLHAAQKEMKWPRKVRQLAHESDCLRVFGIRKNIDIVLGLAWFNLKIQSFGHHVSISYSID